MDRGSRPQDLVLDVGNSRTKLALFSGAEVVRHSVVANGDSLAVRAFLGDDHPGVIALGSVAAPDPDHLKELGTIAPVVVLNGASPAPIKNAYGTPMTLGADRLANVVAGVQRFPSRPLLMIDLGTCITYDVCEADGTYSGGAISPGLVMRARAMHEYSARLPLVDPQPVPKSLGTSTGMSLEAGLHYGILGELQGFIQRYRTDRPHLAVLLTGGDALRFSRALESGIFALPFLTLEGYHALLIHHLSLHGGAPFPVPASGGGAGAAG